MDIACPVHGDPAFRKPAPEEIAKARAEIVQTPETAAALAAGSLAEQIESAKRALSETPDYLKGAAAEALRQVADQAGERSD